MLRYLISQVIDQSHFIRPPRKDLPRHEIAVEANVQEASLVARSLLEGCLRDLWYEVSKCYWIPTMTSLSI